MNKNAWHIFVKVILIYFLIVVTGESSYSQYFGQNKMRYKKLDFKVYDIPHFNLYYYLKNDSMMNWLANETEVWYKLHQKVLPDTFTRKNPVIFYNNHPDFQQTTVINGEIGVGTGGVTEAFKQRVVMPIMQLNQQTRHVLGHELAHAFQYRLVMEGRDTTRLENIGNIPLWMIEGMAEYLSIGKRDAFTAMWMRDAYSRNDIPSLKQMTEQSYKYFPYRYGQAFWSYIGSTYGDTVIMPLFMETAKYGYELGVQRVFGYDAQTISTLWKNSVENAYKALGKDTSSRPIGVPLITSANGGRMNVSPSISPNGKYIVYLSEQDLFSIDMFLADAQTGKMIRKLGSKLTNSDIDEFSFIESTGAFSPDSKKFAFSVFSEGKNKLMAVDVETGKVLFVEAMGDLVEFGNITWSPDGQSVAFSGLKNGYSDLYTFNLNTKELVQLTDDYYSDYQPSYSRDGRFLVFSTDRLAFLSNNQTVDIPMNIALYDLQTRQITNLDLFPGGNNLNPLFSIDDKSILFLSNGDGYRNLYSYNLSSKEVYKLTDYFTGISGITEFSPAISLSVTNDLVYSFFKDNGYSIYKSSLSEFTPIITDASRVDFTAALLPPFVGRGVDLVNRDLEHFGSFVSNSHVEPKTVPYKPQFKLDYIANTGVGVSVGSRYGAGLSGGVYGVFSDILGYNQIQAVLSVNGEIYDFGGQVAYVNSSGRLTWGGSVSHIPYIYGFRNYGLEDFGRGQELAINDYYIRQFESQVDGFVAYPFNRYTRFEVNASLARYAYRIDKWRRSYYNGYGDKQKVSADEAAQLNFGNLDPLFTEQVGAAFVGDKSVFGMTAPLQGYKYRLGVAQVFGDLSFTSYTVDLRKYFRLKPLTLAFRGYSYIRSGKDEDRLRGTYIGYPFFVRGFDDLNPSKVGGLSFDDLMGSRSVIGNIELRLPFTGPEKLAVIKSGFVISDLNLFFDGGLAWSRGNKIVGKLSDKPLVPELDNNGQVIKDQFGDPIMRYDSNYRVPVFSTGVSLRVNLFGAMILEPYYAVPLIKSRSDFGTFGLNFLPGW